MILAAKKTKITEEEVHKKGKLKDYPEKILAVRTDRTIEGFTQEDIGEVKRMVQAMTKELNEKIVSMFRKQSECKMETLQSKLDYNSKNYKERNDEFSHELHEMNDRFDYLKRAEQRHQDIVDYSIVYKEQKRTRRMCFDVLKYYAHTQKNRMAKNLKKYNKGLLKKCFGSLRDNGLENRVKRKVDHVFQKVIKEIKIETLKNINDLKEQISLKELEIKNIRAAKSEFSFHFAQSLLKTINTLNMEVLDLKQKDLDDEFKFAGNLDPNVLERIYQQYLKEMEQINQYDVRVVRKETTRSVQG